jgi:hypothetical protein
VHEGTETSANLTVGNSEQGSSLAAEASIHEEPGTGNRTPGSVRGLSGNWQSYRNQLFLDVNSRNTQFLQQLTSVNAATRARFSTRPRGSDK